MSGYLSVFFSIVARAGALTSRPNHRTGGSAAGSWWWLLDSARALSRPVSMQGTIGGDVEDRAVGDLHPGFVGDGF